VLRDNDISPYATLLHHTVQSASERQSRDAAAVAAASAFTDASAFANVPPHECRMHDSESSPSLASGSMNFYASIGAASARNARARYNARASSPTSASSPPASATGAAGAGASDEPLDAAARGADDTLAQIRNDTPPSQDHAGNKVAIVNAVISASEWERVKMPFGEIKMTRLMKACAKGNWRLRWTAEADCNRNRRRLIVIVGG